MKKLFSKIARHPRFRLAASFAVFFASVMVTALAFAQQPAPGPGGGHGRRIPRPAISGLRNPPPVTQSPTPTGSGAQHTEHVENGGGPDHPENAEGGEHGEHAGHGPEPLNWTDISDSKRPAIIALVINFGVLMAAYYLLGKTPIANALKQRRVTIGKEIDDAQKMLDEAKERAKVYQAKRKNADVDAATAKSTIIASGTGEVEHLLTETREKADRMKRDADRLVEQERKAEQQAILGETIEKAGDEAAALLQKSVTADDHARLAQDLLLELARRPAHRTGAST